MPISRAKWLTMRSERARVLLYATVNEIVYYYATH